MNRARHDHEPASHAAVAASANDRAFDRILRRQMRHGLRLTSTIAFVSTLLATAVHASQVGEAPPTIYAAVLSLLFIGVRLASNLATERWLDSLAAGFGLTGIAAILGALVVNPADTAGYLTALVGPIPVAMALLVPWRTPAHLAWLAAGGGIIVLATIVANDESMVSMQQPGLMAGYALGAAFSIVGHRMVAGIRRRIVDQVRHAHRQRAELVEARRRSVDALARLQAIEAIGRRLADEGPTPEALDAVMGLLVDGFGYTYPSIYVGDARRVRLGAQRGYETPIEEFDATLGVTGRLLRTKQAQLVVDVATDPDYVAACRDVRSEIQVPLLAENRLLGVLNVESRVPLEAGDLASMQVVADRVAASMALAAHRRELLEAQRMESIGRLAGGVAHDFNNLLTVITGYAAQLIDSLPPDAEGARSSVDAVLSAADRAAELTRQLLGFARRSVLEPRDVELNAIVHGVEPMLRRLIGERITLVTDLDDDAGWVRVDAALLGQVIVNLVVNARDAMPSGGTVTIGTAACLWIDIDPGLAVEGDHRVAALAVTDSGTGIDPDVREHIFEPFVTTKAPGQGTGLGLATTHGIVAQ